ncbi:hypothetical protein KGQ19_00270 [Catenulispora sp. NL8]|uniref:Immunity protein Imm1 n=1 Tax=Catenulispora pinistramenti TaxID=2705254 RepID=A0ABS5KGB8_9ACTN|nr:Imm1 family immunity protein [Catenulispora pinistramenti]MBS2545292.1 hypothetical protein [Catenulispora pinistramenti]
MMQHRVEARYRRDHGKEPVILTTSEDVDTLIESLLTGPAYHNMAQLHSLERSLLPSGYPDHELLIGVNRDRPVGVLAFMDADSGNLVTQGSSNGQSEAAYLIMGQLTEFPDRSEVPIELVRQAVKEFVDSGGQRPLSVQWQVPEVW